ncbi:MAG: cell surface protein SprA [Dysgonomonas sp.]|nr:cell surface protein SprA [Dysgonomonas sp.]
MKQISKYFILTLLLITGISLFSSTIWRTDISLSSTLLADQDFILQDTSTLYPVKKTQITEYEDLTKSNPIDLRDPSNVKTEIEYDLKNNIYLFKTKIDNDEWITPFTLNPDQYSEYSLKKSMSEYFKQKNTEAFAKGTDKNDFSLRDIRVNTGALERLFGPGGVQVKTQGYIEVGAGLKHTKSDNPTIPQRNRSRFMFDFNEKIQMNATASVGSKINFGLNYDTESTFDFDTKRIKLAYQGEEDEILKHLEAGNVSMTTTNSLINGGSSLFGIKADLQFGKLKISTVISQQESESQTVNSQGGVQTIPFEFKADEYDENQHFFLGYYFRENFNDGMKRLPYISSKVLINKIEVWITNKQGNFDNARNIVAFSTLAEGNNPKNNLPNNNVNSLYNELNTIYSAARDIKSTSTVLSGFENGVDYEKLESARMLEASEYSFHSQLGYLSLNTPLSPDQVLAVAYSYTVDGTEYRVGEFAANIPSLYVEGEKTGALFLKLLKPVSMSPSTYTWDLMMKNIYKLGANQIQKDKFRLNISYQSDTLGTYINYLPEGKIKNKLLLKVMNLDRLNSQNKEVKDSEGNEGDGIFDFIEGATILPENGRIIFPVVEPFGTHLAEKIGDPDIAKKYVYQELYDMTLTAAQQVADKNKFKISGSYRGSTSSSVLSLNAMNVARGSVKVTANGTTLTENVDYTVDYTSGEVTIINQSLIDAGTPISVSLENQSMFNMKRKTLLGLNLSYDFSKDFTIGGTIMHMYEKPLTMKTGIGEESLKNTLWGLNTSYRTSSQWLTNLVDKLPFVNATAPSQISFNAEFAHLIAGHYENEYAGGYSYLDDFESAKSRISVLQPYGWKLASTPSLFEESKLINDPKYGNNRAHMSWFTIDNIFNRRRSSTRPTYLNNDSISNHYVRAINTYEIYPNRDVVYNESSYISTLNLSYYPNQRGPYNLSDTIDSEGNFLHPEYKWGGMMRKLDNTNFETSNIEYIEFWLMDPFVYGEYEGGELHFNLGEVSEDILKDGKKFYENGLPTEANSTDVEYTAWGKVPTRQSTVYAFDNSLSTADRIKQDAGLNGLTTEEELQYGPYVEYINKLNTKLSDEAQQRMQNDPFSPLNDPGGDNFHHFRGADYDNNRVSILDRYKYYNGTEGNTTSNENSNDTYSTAAYASPDVEDLNQDYTMNENENYYQYKVELRPEKMVVGKNYIADKRSISVDLFNDTKDSITWYLFKIPLKDPQNGEKPQGNISDFKTIRFMRMFMTKFQRPTFLRFATLDLVRGEWRTYTRTNSDGINVGSGSLNLSTVNIEENGDKEPVNYVVPPGVSRIVDPNQAQLRQDNEQALSLQILDLEPKDAKAVYKNTNYDLRRYKRLQMFTHAESLINGPELQKGEITVFLRLGSDYINNYYEYEIPLAITPPSTQYNSNSSSDRLTVWPQDNMFDFQLELLTNLKLERNREKRKGNTEAEYTKVYSIYDPNKAQNKISIKGNPSLSEVSVMMVGIRNNSSTNKSGEVWVNELRMTDYDERGGWAAQGNLNISLSDIATFNFTGRKETAGFGAIDQSLQERRSDDYSTYTISTNVDLGRFLPEKAKISAPLYYSYSNQTTTPEYDPLDQDIKLKDALKVVETKAEKDSIKNLAQEKTTTKSFSLTNVRVNIASKNPMPYDPANFTFGHAFSKTETSNPTTTYDLTYNSKSSLSYSYSPIVKPWEPFKKIKSNSGWTKYPKSLGINLLPNNISFNSVLTRYYTETLIRDIESYTLGGDNSSNQFLSWSQSYYWDRDFSITWDLLKNLKVNLQTGTRAEIEEPYLQVNKKLNPDDYEIWKDSVSRSIRNLGTPLSYRQTAQVTYTLPTQQIPVLSWINSNASYMSNYTWDRGADIDDVEVGNTITNNMTLNINNRFDLTALYNKSSFLKTVNQKFDTQRNRNTARRQAQRPAPRRKPFEIEVSLESDTGTIVRHGLNTKRIIVSAKEGTKIKNIKYKRIDANTIRITTKDSTRVKINVVAKSPLEENTWYQVAQYAARGLMSVRSVSFNYSSRKETSISGFQPSIGDAFGQGRSDYGLSPGLGFAFGFDGGEDFLDRALDRGWMIMNEENINPAVYNSIRKIEMEAQLEPIRGLKIRLNALHEKNDRTSIQYNTSNKLRTLGGSFTMTTVALSSSFGSGNAGNNYQSSAFDKFIEYRNTIANRLQSKYNTTYYPNKGFLAGNVGGSEYNPDKGRVDANSADVLIPAFLAAYTGKNVNKISLSAFPALTSMLPNWTISYDGLTTLPWFKDKFRSFRLMHAYTAQYRIGSYSSFTTWVDAGSGLGFHQGLDAGDASGAAILPSSPYDISSVNLIEQFNPLIGADGTMNNSLSIRARYNYTRALNLNITAFQLVETLQKDLVIGAGYTINEFNKVIGLRTRNATGFNNDLKINADLSRRTSQSLIRKIEDKFTEATSGSTVLTLKLSAEYTLSKSLLLRGFFDRVVNTPLISSTAYPTANTNFGVSIRFTLTQ